MFNIRQQRMSALSNAYNFGVEEALDIFYQCLFVGAIVGRNE